jgi:tetratricopeptide (TPR) repeat protein
MSTKEKAETLKKQGNTQFQAGKYIEALQSYTSAIELVDDDKTFYSNRAFCYIKLKKYKKCMLDCTKAIELDQNFAKAWARRGEAELAIGQITESISDYVKAHDLEPANIVLKKGIEEAELMKSYQSDLVKVLAVDDIEAAIRKTEMILEGCPEFSDMELQRMELWNKHGDLEKTLNR